MPPFVMLRGSVGGLDMAREDFVGRLTHYYAEVNAVHPFREGNGRAQRAFLGQIAKAAGYPIRWARLDPERNLDTARQSHGGNNSPLHEMLSDLLETTLRREHLDLSMVLTANALQWAILGSNHAGGFRSGDVPRGC